MRMSTAFIGAGVLITAAVGATSSPVATASPSWGLNGTYIATSNGEWAKTNDIFHDEASIRGTWTISTTCSYPSECTGTVDTDWGWSAPIYKKSGVWYVKKTVDNWQPCGDGTAGPGLQVYRFFPSNKDATATDPSSTTLLGEDSTTGVSGSCGSSRVVFITMPFKLVKAS
ncbi:hypothetical protein A5731_14620 [Mycolicibacterium conceptionense]|uniref:Secreted protein n=2 Tax=Mycolicibacterium TaxID=1866885 RepID=A0A1A1YVA3_9MYCO|nr:MULTISPECIES: hypothetical protein [Mycolicibacterium]MCW1820171.1 hypothetical protein [Mycolicibacterium senegalense]OBB07308.1 hypothetical protein A5718_17640 [Mycolicibacterium conceptionense]OBF02706.1 hypothetical protein A5731_14620 [Mycolicibacterium conceptionense]OBF23451.1 hypothetical protein A5726_11395 [Mycolicibacterium conceptionense]OBF35252.1 hypothetical protein A5720_01450 [Mycolicibacterium conceptionense]